MEDSRDKAKTYTKECEGFKIITFWQEEIKGVCQAGWVHRIIDNEQEKSNGRK